MFLQKKTNIKNITFRELYKIYYEYQSERVKTTTLTSYRRRIVYLEPILDIKVRKFNIDDYLKWRSYINGLDSRDKTKNGYHKMLKQLIHYAIKWYDFNLFSIDNKMEKFNNPKEIPKEQSFYTYDEFQKFISVETDLKFICIFETLYYCGLRRGELRGLTWDNINFETHELKINKNVVNENGDQGFWEVTTPKTKTSRRVLPMPNVLVNHLLQYKEKCTNEYENFNETFFVFGNTAPIHPYTLLCRKNRNADLAGVKRIRLHDFRHSCASLLVNNNANIMVVAKYLGHAKIEETLDTYSHLFKSSLNEVVNLINNLND